MTKGIDLTQYTEDKVIGTGSYGVVSRLSHIRTGKKLARKRLKSSQVMRDAGFFPRLLREIAVIKKCCHRNIVKLIDIVVDEQPATLATDHLPVASADSDALPGHDVYPRTPGISNTYLFLEYIDHSLASLLHRATQQEPLARTLLVDGQIRVYAKHLFAGLAYLHHRRILHLDIKPDNLLVSKEGVLKIADFGLSREEKECCRYSPSVVTSCYRAPEIFCLQRTAAASARDFAMTAAQYGSTMLQTPPYGVAADVWSAGCVVAEMYTAFHPLFLPDASRRSDVDVVNQMTFLCGTKGWKMEFRHVRLRALSESLRSGKCRRCSMNHAFPAPPEDAVRLLDHLLSNESHARPEPAEALKTDYFAKVDRDAYPPA